MRTVESHQDDPTNTSLRLSPPEEKASSRAQSDPASHGSGATFTALLTVNVRRANSSLLLALWPWSILLALIMPSLRRPSRSTAWTRSSTSSRFTGCPLPVMVLRMSEYCPTSLMKPRLTFAISTKNLQRIINQAAGKNVLFFPHGTYLVSDTLVVPPGSR